MKAHFAAHIRYAKAVAIAADAFNHTVDQRFGFWVINLAKAERVHRCNRTGAMVKTSRKIPPTPVAAP